MKHEFQSGHLLPTHCRVYIEREGFCGLPASHDLHMPEVGEEMSQSSEQEAPELLPCPFCGSNFIVLLRTSDKTKWFAMCNEDDSDCPMEIVQTHECDTIEEVKKLWNTRTRSDICASLVEALIKITAGYGEPISADIAHAALRKLEKK